VRAALGAAAAALPAQAGEPLTPGNVLVSIETCCSWQGFAEHARDGAEVRRVTIPPPPSWGTPGDARDLVVDEDGRVAVFNSRSPEFLSIWDPELDSWHHTTPPDPWEQPNVSSFGGIAALGDRVFATDAWDYLPDPKFGLLVYDRLDDVWQRFAEEISPCDVNLGLDGLLYAVHPASPPGGGLVDVYDPETLSFVRRIDLAAAIGGPVDNRTVAVDRNGDLFVGTWNGWLHHLDPAGELVASVRPPCPSQPGGCLVLDVDISRDGELVLATRHGLILFTDTSFSSFDGFQTYAGRNPFVAWVPEPPLQVRIEVRPPAISLPSDGLVWVELFGSDDLDVDDVAVELLRLGPGGAAAVDRPRPRSQDVDADGHPDLLVAFRQGELELDGSEAELCLSGSTGSGLHFEGCGGIAIAGACGPGAELALVVLPAALWSRRRALADRGRRRKRPIEPGGPAPGPPGAGAPRERLRQLAQQVVDPVVAPEVLAVHDEERHAEAAVLHAELERLRHLAEVAAAAERLPEVRAVEAGPRGAVGQHLGVGDVAALAGAGAEYRVAVGALLPFLAREVPAGAGRGVVGGRSVVPGELPGEALVGGAALAVLAHEGQAELPERRGQALGRVEVRRERDRHQLGAGFRDQLVDARVGEGGVGGGEGEEVEDLTGHGAPSADAQTSLGEPPSGRQVVAPRPEPRP
jgi:hypothetical protein